MNIASIRASTRANTDPIQIGYHPMNVKRTVESSVENETVTSGLFPFVAIKTTSIKEILDIIEIIIPASVDVTPIADAIPMRYSSQITILIREKRGGQDI